MLHAVSYGDGVDARSLVDQIGRVRVAVPSATALSTMMEILTTSRKFAQLRQAVLSAFPLERLRIRSYAFPCRARSPLGEGDRPG